MERYCFTFELKPGMEDEYRARHDEIWPEMVAAIREAGIANYSLFRRGTEVIAYCECQPDARTAFARMADSDVNTRWSEWFEDVIDRIVDEQGRHLVAEEVWHLD